MRDSVQLNGANPLWQQPGGATFAIVASLRQPAVLGCKFTPTSDKSPAASRHNAGSLPLPTSQTGLTYGPLLPHRPPQFSENVAMQHLLIDQASLNKSGAASIKAACEATFLYQQMLLHVETATSRTVAPETIMRMRR